MAAHCGVAGVWIGEPWTEPFLPEEGTGPPKSLPGAINANPSPPRLQIKLFPGDKKVGTTKLGKLMGETTDG